MRPRGADGSEHSSAEMGNQTLGLCSLLSSWPSFLRLEMKNGQRLAHIDLGRKKTPKAVSVCLLCDGHMSRRTLLKDP